MTSPTPSPASGRVYHRDVPHEWAAALAEAFPAGPMIAGLVLVWEPGYDWVLEGQRTPEVVERWMLYHAYPEVFLDPNNEVDAQLLAELKGPPPESLRQVIPIPEAPVPGTVRVVPGTSITQRQWELFRQTGRYCQPAWCIQGEHGGHPMAYPPVFQYLMRSKGKRSTPPLPGELPYAPFDGRVIAALKQYENLFVLAGDVKRRKRQVGFINREQARKVKQMAVDWLSARLDENADEILSGVRTIEDRLPSSDVDYVRKLDEFRSRVDSDPA